MDTLHYNGIINTPRKIMFNPNRKQYVDYLIITLCINDLPNITNKYVMYAVGTNPFAIWKTFHKIKWKLH